MSEKRVEYVERENLRGETVRRFEISFGAGTVRVINVESALYLAKWIYELATENGIENEHARLEAQVETLQKKLAHERGCDECWKEHGKFGTCGSDCLMADALLEADGDQLQEKIVDMRDALRIEHGPVDDSHGGCYACDALRAVEED